MALAVCKRTRMLRVYLFRAAWLALQQSTNIASCGRPFAGQTVMLALLTKSAHLVLLLVGAVDNNMGVPAGTCMIVDGGADVVMVEIGRHRGAERIDPVVAPVNVHGSVVADRVQVKAVGVLACRDYSQAQDRTVMD